MINHNYPLSLQLPLSVCFSTSVCFQLKCLNTVLISLPKQNTMTGTSISHQIVIECDHINSAAAGLFFFFFTSRGIAEKLFFLVMVFLKKHLIIAIKILKKQHFCVTVPDDELWQKQTNTGFASFRLSFEKQTNSLFESSVFDSVLRETIYFILLNLSGSVSAGEHTYSDSSVSTIIYGALKTLCLSDSTNCTSLLYCGGFSFYGLLLSIIQQFHF